MKFINSNQNIVTNSKSVLKVITLSGTESVTKNCYIYEYKDEIIIVDCGIGFPDIFDMPGVDLLLPDFSYLHKNSHKIKALFITHGHEDHVGAVPNFLLEFPDVPVYASKLVLEFLKTKMAENGFNQVKNFKNHLVSPEDAPVDIGNFKVSAIRINHSVPETMGYAIKTPEGTVLHISDYKFDDTPILDKPADVEKIERLGREGVLCLASDCLGVTTEGHTESESTLTNTFTDLFEKAGKRQLFITTVSSNVSRMHQIMSAAQKFGRKVCVSGRSIEQMVSVARKLGYLPFQDDFFVGEKESQKMNQSEIVYLIAGCYGQPGSSPGRLSRGEHETLNLEDNALVVFSADPSPPGAGIMVDKLTDALILKNAEVVYGEIQENLHVSGHAVRGDIERMTKLVNAKYYIPIGGTITKMRFYTNVLKSLGISKDRVFECLEGDCVEFQYGNAKKGERIEVKPIYLGGNKTEELSPVVVRDRNVMCNDGVFVVVVPMSRKNQVMNDKIEIITRGFIYVKDSQELMKKSKKFISKRIGSIKSRNKDLIESKKKLENDISGYLRKETSMSPMIIVHYITI